MVKKAKKKKKASSQMGVSEGDHAQASNGSVANRVYVAVARTLNLGNYESLRVEYGEGRAVPDGARFADVRQQTTVDAIAALDQIVELVRETCE